MKKLLAIALILCPTLLMAQWEHKHTVGVSAGYEINVFLNPSSLERDGEVQGPDELWDNGTFQALQYRLQLERQLSAGRLKVAGGASGSLYQTEMNANRYAYDLSASYRVKYADRKYLEVAPQVDRIKRAGINLADAVIRTPFSYQRVLVPLHLDFYLGNRVWLKTQVGYLYKNYDRENGESLHYSAPVAELALSKKWLSEAHTQKVTFTGGAQLRHYVEYELTADAPLPNANDEEEGDFDDFEVDEGREGFEEDEDYEEDEETEDDEPEEELGDEFYEEKLRDWHFYRTQLVYEIEGEDSPYEVSVGLYHLTRLDQDQRNTYHQVSPSISLSYGTSKAKVSISGKYSYRYYPNLTPGKGNDNLPLIYQYLRGSARVQFGLGEHLTWWASGQFVYRLSNNPDPSSLAFQGYFNPIVETGIRYRF
ncbi:MAG TPA: hypothetical protein DCP28_20725 [Cytophagales bacterium]|nr:hypothetical protein [Cytophagales bacterium]